MIILICSESISHIDYLFDSIERYMRCKKRNSIIKKFTSIERVFQHCSYYGEPDIIFYQMTQEQDFKKSNIIILRRLCPNSEIVIMSEQYSDASVGYQIHATWFLKIPFEAKLIYDSLDVCVYNVRAKMKNQFVIEADGNNIAVKYNDIKYFESDKHYIKMHTDAETLCFRESLGTLYLFLPYNMFVRSHKCYVVNVCHINQITKREIILCSGDIVPLSRNYYNPVCNAFRLYVHTGRN